MRSLGGAIARNVLAMAGRRSPWGSGNGDGEGKAGEDAFVTIAAVKGTERLLHLTEKEED